MAEQPSKCTGGFRSQRFRANIGSANSLATFVHGNLSIIIANEHFTGIFNYCYLRTDLSYSVFSGSYSIRSCVFVQC